MRHKNIKIVEPLDLQNEISVRKSQLVDMYGFSSIIRSEGSLKGKALYLPASIDGQKVDEWIIAKDEHDNLCVIPLRKDS